MNHETEFSAPAAATSTAANELAACYARLFLGSDDGKRVLRDLRAKFGLQRLCFTADERGRFDYLRAAVTDGERRVMSEIERALQLGAPNQALSEKPQP